ncbi:oogenesin-1-like [Onychomys torridus]|uniref:oogenesin-1-like n=1 Tax=Onychomys torridus TaxID=38674 RepID=UPI00167F3828|nr:oogenesin-1-like [Onychomys torridus]
MGDRDPPTLQQLAIEGLLREEALAISALEVMPPMLLPAMFEVAFKNRQTNVLRAMVPIWPFPYLPVGALIKTPHLETLKALLGGLDAFFKQMDCPRKGKVRVLDLTTTDSHCWSIWAGTYEGDCSQQVVRHEQQPMETCHDSGMKNNLKVVTELKLVDNDTKEYATHLVWWAEKKKDSIHLCCLKLQIWEPCISNVIEVLKSVDLQCIRELHLRSLWIDDMAAFGPYLGQMRNLHTLVLEGITNNFRMDESQGLEEEWISTLLSQFPKFHCLQHLYIDDIYLLVGCMREWLRSLKKPLETLSIKYCHLSQADLDHLPQCLNLSELRHLHLSSLLLAECLGPLGLLLERVKATLQSLELEKCWLEDSGFRVLLPALSQCSQLTKVNFIDNNLSLPLLMQLLHNIAKLSKLTQELYPAPLECYDPSGLVLVHQFDQLCPELMAIIRTERKPKKVTFATRQCHKCFSCSIYELESRHCLCSQ